MAGERLRTFLEANLTLLGAPFEIPNSSLPSRSLNPAIASLNAHLRESAQTLFSRAEQRRFILSATAAIAREEAQQATAADTQISDLPAQWPGEGSAEAKQSYAPLRARVAQLEDRVAQAKTQAQRYAALASAVNEIGAASGGLLRPGSALSDSLNEASQLVSQLRSRLTPEKLVLLSANQQKRAAAQPATDLAAIQAMTKRTRRSDKDS